MQTEQLIEEVLKEFDELTYKWTMALSPSQSYEELCRDFFIKKLRLIASKSAEAGFLAGYNEYPKRMEKLIKAQPKEQS